jgi:hypothetical protein
MDIKEIETDSWHVQPALFVSLVLLVATSKKKRKNEALVASI